MFSPENTTHNEQKGTQQIVFTYLSKLISTYLTVKELEEKYLERDKERTQEGKEM